MNIPDKAVEAAAQALYEEEENASMGFDAWPQWDEAPPEGQESFRILARAALVAARPALGAQVLRDEALRWTTAIVRPALLRAADEMDSK